MVFPVLPISGRLDPNVALRTAHRFYLLEAIVTTSSASRWPLLKHLALPAGALRAAAGRGLTRVLKSSLLESMKQDYVTLARVKGYSRARVLWRVALPNALIPAVTLTGVQFTFWSAAQF